MVPILQKFLINSISWKCLFIHCFDLAEDNGIAKSQSFLLLDPDGIIAIFMESLCYIYLWVPCTQLRDEDITGSY